MEEFILRELTFKSGKFKVVRKRNSNGCASISIIDSSHSVILTMTNNNNFDYEEDARILAKLLNEAANNPCTLSTKGD